MHPLHSSRNPAERRFQERFTSWSTAGESVEVCHCNRVAGSRLANTPLSPRFLRTPPYAARLSGGRDHGAHVRGEHGKENVAEEESGVAASRDSHEKLLRCLDFGGVGLHLGRDGVPVTIALEKEYRHIEGESKLVRVERKNFFS